MPKIINKEVIKENQEKISLQTDVETNSVVADYTFTMLKAALDISNAKIDSLEAEMTALKGV